MIINGIQLSLDDLLATLLALCALGMTIRSALLFARRGAAAPITTVFGRYIPDMFKRGPIVLHETVHLVTLAPHICAVVVGFGWIPIRLVLGLPPMVSLLLGILVVPLLLRIPMEMLADAVCIAVYGPRRYFRSVARVMIYAMKYSRHYRSAKNRLMEIVLQPQRLLFNVTMFRWFKKTMARAEETAMKQRAAYELMQAIVYEQYGKFAADRSTGEEKIDGS